MPFLIHLLGNTIGPNQMESAPLSCMDGELNMQMHVGRATFVDITLSCLVLILIFIAVLVLVLYCMATEIMQMHVRGATFIGIGWTFLQVINVM